jgi:hypothetical protein
MSVQITWAYDPSVTIASFMVSVSTDGGATFSQLATISFNTAIGAVNYNQKTKQFFYVDGTGVSGNIYSVAAVGANGTSNLQYVVAPVLAYPTCTIYGYVIDAAGNVDTSIDVLVTSFGTRGERWMKKPTGLAAFNPMSLGVVSSSLTVYPDATGVWQVTLLQGAYATISIDALDFSWTFETPASNGPINIRDIQQLRGAALGVFPELVGDRNRFPES